MIIKLLEVRDRGTFIPVIAIAMVVESPGTIPQEAREARRWLLRRCGYAEDDRHPTITLASLAATRTADRPSGKTFCADPHDWGDRTYHVAHVYIERNWHDLKDGDVVDVEFILGETAAPKQSERGE